MELTLNSPAFRNGEIIPSRYTCDREDISPPLRWEQIPPGTRSLALICDDPDAPRGTWVHWVVYNLPADTRELPEGIGADEMLESGALQGVNDFSRIGYGGPCPPAGVHRYYFKLFALDTELDLPAGSTKQQLLEAMDGHILAEGRLLGRYRR